MDPDGIIWMRGLLRGLASEGRAVLVSSHLLSELQGLVDHLVVVGRGRVLADAPVTELLAGAASLEAAYVALTRDAIEFHGGAAAQPRGTSGEQRSRPTHPGGAAAQPRGTSGEQRSHPTHLRGER
jgi:ABC-type multidrug transport system ATPase subunit